MKKIVVIGCGAAGMLAAIQLARKGHSVTVLEKNEKAGKKLFITGKGRCNITNNCDEETFLKNVVSNPKFLYSSIYNFNPEATIAFFEELGLRLTTQRGNRVFPESEHSSDVIAALTKEMKRLGVEVWYNTCATELVYIQDLATDNDNYEKSLIKVKSVRYRQTDVKNSGELEADCVVVATGGMSYQATGSTGDGYRFAGEIGMKLVESRPALVPLEIKEELCKRLMGVSLKNVSVCFEARVKGKTRKIYEDFGEMLFTHFGVSGPVILSASSVIGKYMDNGIDMYIDFKPAITKEQLDARILRDFDASSNKQLRNAIAELLPKSLLPEIIAYAKLDMYKKVNEVSKEERLSLVDALKHFKLTVKGTRDFNEAIITQGGVAVSEINPQTMQAKRTENLYFIGEVLDLDAYTGGYNLQIAWSTAMNVDIKE